MRLPRQAEIDGNIECRSETFSRIPKSRKLFHLEITDYYDFSGLWDHKTSCRPCGRFRHLSLGELFNVSLPRALRENQYCVPQLFISSKPRPCFRSEWESWNIHRDTTHRFWKLSSEFNFLYVKLGFSAFSQRGKWKCFLIAFLFREARRREGSWRMSEMEISEIGEVYTIEHSLLVKALKASHELQRALDSHSSGNAWTKCFS